MDVNLKKAKKYALMAVTEAENDIKNTKKGLKYADEACEICPDNQQFRDTQTALRGQLEHAKAILIKSESLLQSINSGIKCERISVDEVFSKAVNKDTLIH